MSLTIKGKDKYLEQIVDKLEEEGIELESKHSTPKSDDFLDLGVFGRVGRYCHSHPNPDLQAQLPSHRKNFIKTAIKRNKDNE